MKETPNACSTLNKELDALLATRSTLHRFNWIQCVQSPHQTLSFTYYPLLIYWSFRCSMQCPYHSGYHSVNFEK